MVHRLVFELELARVYLVVVVACLVVGCTGNFNKEVEVSWGGGKILDNGRLLNLILDRSSGSGFQSKNEYLFGKIDVQLKLVPGNSAGTVTTFYLSSQGATHDEIDLEFLGNLTGQPYTLHTNVYTQGKGNREMQFRLWFDPTSNFHTYTIILNPKRIIFSVDGTPIREFKNMERQGVPFPTKQPMMLYGSLWNADDWATQSGRVKTDWSKAPFIASYRNLNVRNACVWFSLSGKSSCSTTLKSKSSSSSYSSSSLINGQELDSTAQSKMKWVQNNYMIYNYCADTNRFPQGLPKECTATTS